jgi:hypothetical protein
MIVGCDILMIFRVIGLKVSLISALMSKKRVVWVVQLLRFRRRSRMQISRISGGVLARCAV